VAEEPQGRVYNRNGKPLSQVEVETMIGNDIELLEKATNAYEAALEREAHTVARYKRDYASAFLNAAGAKYIKEATADLECDTQLTERLVVEAEVKALREHLWTIRTRLEGLRSLNANIRVQV